jgi:hypothetical protein
MLLLRDLSCGLVGLLGSFGFLPPVLILLRYATTVSIINYTCFTVRAISSSTARVSVVLFVCFVLSHSLHRGELFAVSSHSAAS